MMYALCAVADVVVYGAALVRNNAVFVTTVVAGLICVGCVIHDVFGFYYCCCCYD